MITTIQGCSREGVAELPHVQMWRPLAPPSLPSGDPAP